MRWLHALPVVGGLDDQPAPIVQALRVCEIAMHEYKAWRTGPVEMTSDQAKGYVQMMINAMRKPKAPEPDARPRKRK